MPRNSSTWCAIDCSDHPESGGTYKVYSSFNPELQPAVVHIMFASPSSAPRPDNS